MRINDKPLTPGSISQEALQHTHTFEFRQGNPQKPPKAIFFAKQMIDFKVPPIGSQPARTTQIASQAYILKASESRDNLSLVCADLSTATFHSLGHEGITVTVDAEESVVPPNTTAKNLALQLNVNIDRIECARVEHTPRTEKTDVELSKLMGGLDIKNQKSKAEDIGDALSDLMQGLTM